MIRSKERDLDDIMEQIDNTTGPQQMSKEDAIEFLKDIQENISDRLAALEEEEVELR